MCFSGQVDTEIAGSLSIHGDSYGLGQSVKSS